MDEKTYHHGDLRNTLIEAGIELINEKGIVNLLEGYGADNPAANGQGA